MYLNEKILGIVLSFCYNENIITNKKILSNYGYRPDYTLIDSKIVYEFNGYRHYTSHEQILKDYKKKKIFIEEGYIFIEIPYFVQLSCSVCRNLLKLTDEQILKIPKEYINSYPNGFIDDKSCKPYDFCREGYERYQNDIEYLYRNNMIEEANQIKDSEHYNKQKIEELYNSSI